MIASTEARVLSLVKEEEEVKRTTRQRERVDAVLATVPPRPEKFTAPGTTRDLYTGEVVRSVSCAEVIEGYIRDMVDIHGDGVIWAAGRFRGMEQRVTE